MDNQCYMQTRFITLPWDYLISQGVKGIGEINNAQSDVFYEGYSELKLPIKVSNVLCTIPMIYDINPGRGENIHISAENSERIAVTFGANVASKIKFGCLVFSLI
ncbi:hypothetical protein [Veillonella magna]|uniref:hypothetical protein n=1 Tax=Veillonella magna TaxID=464322 RepID=UPI0023F4B3F3|nr:hypothetical protein [Veillonella magna]